MNIDYMYESILIFAKEGDNQFQGIAFDLYLEYVDSGNPVPKELIDYIHPILKNARSEIKAGNKHVLKLIKDKPKRKRNTDLSLKISNFVRDQKELGLKNNDVISTAADKFRLSTDSIEYHIKQARLYNKNLAIKLENIGEPITTYNDQ